MPMKIIVLIKSVDLVYAQTGTDMARSYIGADDTIPIINPLDEVAVEFALRIRDRIPSTRVTALSLGNVDARAGLVKCLAVGVDKAVWIQDDSGRTLDAWTRAMALAAYIRGQSYDLILAGRNAIDDNDGMTAPYLAEMINLPQINGVVTMEETIDSDRIVVHRLVERGNKEILECVLPCLLTIDKGGCKPRYPTLPGILRAERQIIETSSVKVLDSRSIGTEYGMTEIKKISNPKPKKRNDISKSENFSAGARLQLLMKGGRKDDKKSSKLIDGASDRALIEMERILRENGNLSN
jgi:electron transfer flavoprotein beta subunit